MDRSAKTHLLIAVVLAALAVAWQWSEGRRHRQEHLELDARLGQAVLDAVDGLVRQQVRAGRYSPTALRAALSDAQETFDLVSARVTAGEGRILAMAVSLAVPPEDRLEVLAQRLETRRPVGRGPPWRTAGTEPLPDGELTIEVWRDRGGLDERLAFETRRSVIAAAAVVLSIGLLVGGAWFRTRSLRLDASLRASRARLEGLETLRRLGAGLVHETKNPLGVVRGFAERIAAGKVDDLQRTARAIVEEADRTVARLDEFLQLSRPALLKPEPVHVRTMFAQLRDLLASDLEEASVTLSVEAVDESVRADPDGLRRLLVNLLLNAIRATPAGGSVELRFEVVRAGRRLAVLDTGEGVPEELRETLFEPYVTGRPGGTGLGLALARRIALDHGWVLRYEPRQPRGTAMIVEIPDARR